MIPKNIPIKDIDFHDQSLYHHSKFDKKELEETKNKLAIKGQDKFVEVFQNQNGKFTIFWNRYVAIAAKELGWTTVKGYILTPDNSFGRDIEHN